MKIDHHLHTSRYSPDSIMDPMDLLKQARKIGLDGVVITEHDYQWDPDELADLAARAPELTILSGAEVSAREGHFLVYGLPDLSEAPPGIYVKDLAELVRRHDGAIVAAHPFRWGQPFEKIVASHGPIFDAVEYASNNVSPHTQRCTRKLLRTHPVLGVTGSSDAHHEDTLGCYYSEFPVTIRTMCEFVAALRNKSSRPRHRAGAWAACGLLEQDPYASDDED